MQVVLGRWRCTLVAVKVLREECTQHANSAALADFRREAGLLQSMRHPYILNFLGACFNCKPVRTSSLSWCDLHNCLLAAYAAYASTPDRVCLHLRR